MSDWCYHEPDLTWRFPSVRPPAATCAVHRAPITSDVEILGINFLGASLGALEGAHLSVIDAEERTIGIKKYLLVNPPLDLAYAVKKIDEWHALGRDLARTNPTASWREQLAKAFAGFTTEELQFLIAEDLRALLPELVYVMQVMHHHNVLPATKDQTRKRLEEAKDVTFMDYRARIAMPLWRLQAAEPRANLESFTKRGSLEPLVLGQQRLRVEVFQRRARPTVRLCRRRRTR